MSLDFEKAHEAAKRSAEFEGKPKPLVAYVAGPCRDDRGEWFISLNIAKARQVAAELWKMGFAVICPHLNTAFMDGIFDEGVDATPWLQGYLEIVRRCDLVVMLEGWENSKGACIERHTAYSHRIPVYYWPLNENGLRRIGGGDIKNSGPVRRYVYVAPERPFFINCKAENNVGSAGFVVGSS